MKLYHVTARANLASILAGGLDPARARGKRKSIWGVVRSRVTWAIVHVIAKPWNAEARISDLVVIELTLPRSSVRRYQRAIWYTVESIGTIPVTPDMVHDAAEFGRV